MGIAFKYAANSAITLQIFFNIKRYFSVETFFSSEKTSLMTFKKNLSAVCINVFIPVIVFSQTGIADSNKIINIDTNRYNLSSQKKEQQYRLYADGIYIYKKPKPFSFLTKSPNDAAGMISTAFNKNNRKQLLIITSSTIVLLFADQVIVDAVKQFSKKINLDPTEKNKILVSIKSGNKETTLLKVPQNLNTALYQLGQGMPGLLIASGLCIFGKINHDYRALSTANQLAESFILMGAATQLLKRITGRETPGEATVPGGRWRFFPSIKNFQNNTPRYDAFPSGHIATLISSVTILAGNYPEKKWILPIGYSLSGLVAFSMINNNVHWISDYPLAIGLGYLCAKQLIKRNRGKLSYTLNYTSGILQPGIIYKF